MDKTMHSLAWLSRVDPSITSLKSVITQELITVYLSIGSHEIKGCYVKPEPSCLCKFSNACSNTYEVVSSYIGCLPHNLFTLRTKEGFLSEQICQCSCSDGILHIMLYVFGMWIQCC